MPACEPCRLARRSCPAPSPDPSVPWGWSEWMQLGEYWLHITACSREHRSYGSALDAFTRAERHSGTEDQKRQAQEQMAYVIRAQDDYHRSRAITPARAEIIKTLYQRPTDKRTGRSGPIQAILEYRAYTDAGLAEAKDAVERLVGVAL